MYEQEDVERYITNIGIDFRKSGEEILLLYCPYCESEADGDYTHFRFNYVKGVFYCHHCNAKGNLYQFKFDRGEIEPISKARRKIYRKPSPRPEIFDVKKNDLLYDSCEDKRGICRDVLENYKVGFSNEADLGQCMIYQYFDENGNVFNRKYRNKDKKMRVEKDAVINYYGLQFLNPEIKFIIVTEGEDDCHALVQMGFSNVLSLPMGCKSYTPEMEKVNDRFDFIIMLFDNDPPGQEGAKSFAEKAGLHKCKNVFLPFKDARDCLLNGMTHEEINALIAKSSVFRHEQIIKAGDIKDEFMKYIMNPEKSLGVQLPHHPKLMSILGGIRTAELTIITGDTGCGKTTWTLNLAGWMEDVGKKSLIMSFENGMFPVILKMILIQSGECVFQYGELQKSQEWLSQQQDMLHEREIYFLNKHGHFGLDEMEKVIEYAVKFYNIEFIFIDHLHYFLHIKYDERLEIDRAIRRMNEWTQRFNIHIFLICHPHSTKNSDEVGRHTLKGASSLKQEAHNLLVVHRDIDKEMGICGDTLCKLSIEKNRFDGKVGDITYDVLDNHNKMKEHSA